MILKTYVVHLVQKLISWVHVYIHFEKQSINMNSAEVDRDIGSKYKNFLLTVYNQSCQTSKIYVVQTLKNETEGLF